MTTEPIRNHLPPVLAAQVAIGGNPGTRPAHLRRRMPGRAGWSADRGWMSPTTDFRCPSTPVAGNLVTMRVDRAREAMIPARRGVAALAP